METKSNEAFLLRDPEPMPVPVRFLAVACGAGLVVGLLLALAMRMRPLVPLALSGGVVALLSAAYFVRRERHATAAAQERIPKLVLDETALAHLDGNDTRTIVTFDRRFGLTLLASPSRTTLVLAITHRDGVEYVAGRRPTGEKHVDLLARALTTPDNDLPIGDRTPVFGDGDRLLELAAALEARAPGGFDRVFLSDAGMADVVLDQRRLRAGQLDFDLAMPLSWRAYGFQEGSTYASHTFQATQIRQGDREVVLVALAPTGELATPSIVSPPPGTVQQGPLAVDAVQRALARDLRLAHCLVELPPSRAHRVAVDRLFMPRIRQALDLAPAEPLKTPRTTEHLAADGNEPLRQSSPGR